MTRNFYGVLTIKKMNADSEWFGYKLSHGLVSHGFQFSSPSKRAIPTGYYGEQSGVARVISELRTYALSSGPRNLHLGVIGVGVGTLAAYAHPGDYIRFYEINPEVVHLARNTNYFTHLTDCPRNVGCGTR